MKESNWIHNTKVIIYAYSLAQNNFDIFNLFLSPNLFAYNSWLICLFVDLKDKFQKYLSEIEGSDTKIKTYNTEIENIQNKIKDTLKENLRINQEKDEAIEKIRQMDVQIETTNAQIENLQKLKSNLEKTQ